MLGVRRAPIRLAALIGLVGALLAGCAGGSGTALAGSGSAAVAGHGCPAPVPTVPGAAESRLPVRALCALPPEAGQVWRTIASGGPFAYPRDGATFQNAERRLPQHDRGYYREYTVPTPGSADRGARRLVTGQGRELYYTGDHYGSFVVVDPAATGG